VQSKARTIVAVVLILLIVGAVVWLGQYIFYAKTARLPKSIGGQMIEKIDENTLELVSLPLEEWMHVDSKDGKYKNPRTGTYSLVGVMQCASCGAKIPLPDIPANAGAAASLHIMENYVCPKCGKKAYR